MKTNNSFCFGRQNYTLPQVEVVEISIEQGFAQSIEEVTKDEEIEF
ncbi:MAG: hypothetical protein J6R13_04190 [Alistipes sp.]|jgi:hypothetical protein|nr:hypothetical protein [Alistipes sp.]